MPIAVISSLQLKHAQISHLYSVEDRPTGRVFGEKDAHGCDALCAGRIYSFAKQVAQGCICTTSLKQSCRKSAAVSADARVDTQSGIWHSRGSSSTTHSHQATACR